MTASTRWIVSWLVGGALVTAPGHGARAAEKDQEDRPTAGKALSEGSFAATLNYRYEQVEDDNPRFEGRNARASTLRSTLSYRSDRWLGLSFYAQFENVTDIGLRYEHNNLGFGDAGNGVTDRPVIADPPGTEVNQAYLRYEGLEEATFTAGRQQISFADQRFIGAVPWRQNWQTFDAARVDVGVIPKTRLVYAWVDGVQRITGRGVDMDTHLVDAEITLGGGTLAPYLYSIDWGIIGFSSLSTRTIGARWIHSWALGEKWSLPYHVELAQQDDVGANPNRVDARYARLEIGGKTERAWARLGYELLGGSPEDGAFSTPLATLHKFNGWADLFLVTPQNGLQDVYLGGGMKFGSIRARGFVHRFRSDSGGLDYGDELDLEVVYESPWKQTFAAKAAWYDAKDFAFDKTVLWVWTSYAF